ncbi:alkaline phosphatase D family protein [Luteipulveratus sp. YIM 133132]|uniref:alkaline phosphatase D family protein n=1 Tax=Luteipulveratus flavus TaxID=3031728 RepID=UPI0023AF4164|nr:alkaline phosphatase D family protein [Luteipulveratus sp. YIM 133132]MDE9366245.1 alkaline phosphatase D family protein [Luteipulveratus sp. YIM 133132]
MPDSSLVLGPLLRHVGQTAATVWVQTEADSVVTVHCDGRSWSSRTFGVHDKHYALIVVDGLVPGTVQEYAVEVDGVRAWPEPESTLPPSRIATLRPDKAPRLAFGSCRTSVPHDREGTKTHGVDALRSYALDMAANADTHAWPDLVVMLGDQVYADEISDEMEEFIRERRGLEEAPGAELKDYIEYAHLYRLAWSDPVNRWLLSTLPSAMIFDDHDVRDDWNTSATWHAKMNATEWWHERIVGALMSYWVYQHVGNLSPKELAGDEVWQLIVQHAESGAAEELDLTATLRALAERVDTQPETYRFSYTRDLGRGRLVMIDSRAARDLRPEHRAMLDEVEARWVDEQLTGDVEHLFIGTSLPFLIAPGIHDLEAINEAISEGAYGKRLAGAGERLRQAVDLEHWGAFQRSFAEVLAAVVEVARGERGTAPRAITFLSGDVHHSYVAQIPREQYGLTSEIVQAVCSPIRNPLPKHARVLNDLLGRGLARPMRWLAGRASKVPDPAYTWSVTEGPWFDNNLAVADVEEDGRLELRWYTGDVHDEQYDAPTPREVARVEIG